MHEFDPSELVGLIKDMAEAGELPSSNLPQLRQLLVCVFGLLFASPGQQHLGSAGPWHHQGPAVHGRPAGATTYSNPGTPQSQLKATAGPWTPGGSAAAGRSAAIGGSTSIEAQRLLRELRKVPLLPVLGQPGLLVAAQGGATSSKGPLAPGSAPSDAADGASAVQVVHSSLGATAKVFFPLNLQTPSQAPGITAALVTPPR